MILVNLFFFLLLSTFIEANPIKHQDFISGENDLIPLNTNKESQTSTTLLPAPLLPLVINSPTQTTPFSTLQQHRQILANHLREHQEVQAFSFNDDPIPTQQPRDPFNEDPSSGQQINGNIAPALLNERLMAKQLQKGGTFGPFQMATINELPTQQIELPKPIVPEVVVRGAAIQDSRLLRSPLRFPSCQQPF